MIKSILIGLFFGLVLIVLSNNLLWGFLLLLLVPAFMDWSGDGDGRQWRSRD